MVKILTVFPVENVQNKWIKASSLLITTTSFELPLTILLDAELVGTG